MRLIHRCRRDLRRHAQHARLAFLLSVEHAAGDEQLHQIALVREAVTHDFTRLIRRFGNVREQPRAVTARHRHAHARGDQARALVLARVDSVAYPHVGESRITHAAHCGDAACQLLLGVFAQRTMQVPTPNGVGNHLLDKVARRACAGGLAVAAQMHMQVDQARHQIRALQIHFLRAGRTHRGGSRPDSADAAIVVHSDGHILLRLHIARAVEQRCMREYVRHGIPLYLPAPMRGHGAESTVRAYQELGKASRENAHMRKSTGVRRRYVRRPGTLAPTTRKPTITWENSTLARQRRLQPVNGARFRGHSGGFLADGFFSNLQGPAHSFPCNGQGFCKIAASYSNQAMRRLDLSGPCHGRRS